MSTRIKILMQILFGLIMQLLLVKMVRALMKGGPGMFDGYRFHSVLRE